MTHVGRLLPIILLSLFPATRTIAQSLSDAPPDSINDGWPTASPSSENLDPALLHAMVDQIRTGPYKSLRSLLLVKNGKLLVEEYFPRQEGDRREQALRRATPVELTSATKSVTSLLVGIAIDQHLIPGADERLPTFFPQYADLFAADPAKSRIRLRDLLSMTAGLSWDEWTHPYTDPRNNLVQMIRSPDPLRYVLERPVVAPPGIRFAYNSGASTLLGQILLQSTALRADAFARKNLFEPLGISDFYWSRYPDEIVQTGGGLFLRPRDLVKIGELLLNAGRYNDKQIVSPQWLAESTAPSVPPDLLPPTTQSTGYAFQWWLNAYGTPDHPIPSIEARGRGGQFPILLPTQKIVVVLTSNPDNPNTFQPLDLLRHYLLPAARALPTHLSK